MNKQTTNNDIELLKIKKIEEVDINDFFVETTNNEEFENVDWNIIEKCFFKNGKMRKCFIFKYDFDEDGGFTWEVKLPQELKGINK